MIVAQGVDERVSSGRSFAASLCTLDKRVYRLDTVGVRLSPSSCHASLGLRGALEELIRYSASIPFNVLSPPVHHCITRALRPLFGAGARTRTRYCESCGRFEVGARNQSVSPDDPLGRSRDLGRGGRWDGR